MRVLERSEALLLTFVFVGCRSKSSSLRSRPHLELRAHFSRRREKGWGGVPGRSGQPRKLATEDAPTAACVAREKPSVARTCAPTFSGDRKICVYGPRVSVGVDIDGRRLCKTKNLRGET